jgi:DNA-binding GntR family transcriptional regulator
MFGEVVRIPTLPAATANNIREAILSGQLSPGTPLRDIELSKNLNVSRGTVREALRILNVEGLVELSPHHGASVLRLTPEKVEEIYTLRALIEPYAVRIALEKHAYCQKDLDYLLSLVKRLGELNLQGDILETPKVDIEFHRVLSQPSGHKLLLQVLGNLQSQTLFFILQTKLYRSDLTSDDVSHGVILAAVCEGDPAYAENILRQHIVESGTSFLDQMEKRLQNEASNT